MAITTRPIREDEVEQFRQTMGIPFAMDPHPDGRETFARHFEWERLRAAFDGGQMVATFGAFSLRVTVPGGRVPMAGTTVVTVLPTHRRRGILRRLMREHLEELHESGEPLAGLWASESSIYGRFGYGSASERAEIKLQKPWARLRHPAGDGYVRFVTKEEAAELFAPIFAVAAQDRPGMFERTTNWWQNRVLPDPEYKRHGSTACRHAVCFRNEQPVSYVSYRSCADGGDHLTGIEIRELLAVDPAAEQQAWQFLFGIDLVTSYRCWNRPVDDSLFWWLEQPRRATRVVEDALWVRLVNIAEALCARKYSASGRLVLEVQDEFCPWNAQRYLLEVDEDQTVRCEPTNASAEVTLSASTLGSVYLGGHRLANLARAGLAHGAEDAIQRMVRMFAWHRAPWVQELF